MPESVTEHRSHSFPAHSFPAHSVTDRIYYRPLIPLLIAFIAGITGANCLPEQAWPVCSGIFVSAGIIIYSIYHHKNARLSPLLLFFCLGYYALTPWITSSFSHNHVRQFVNDNILWKISGTIEDSPLFQDFRTVCIINHIRLSRPNSDGPPISVHGKIRAGLYKEPGNLTIGDRLTFTSKIRPFTNFKNPGGFDYNKYMAFKQVWGNAYTSFKKITIAPSSNNLQKQLSSVRKKISDLITQASDGDANAILNALILGDRQSISKPLREAFNRSGISHILAISGLHIGIVASFAFFLFTWLLSRFNPFLRHAWTRKGAAVLSLIPIMIYGIMAGMSPSTQRAVIMVGVFLLTFLIEREHDLINTVSIAALIILIIAPPSLFSVSFQLSFVAVLSITYGVSRIFQSKEKPENLPSYLAKTVVTFMIVSGLAIIGTAPLTMFYFNQISLTGIFSNLIFVPLIGFAVVPLGLFSVMVLMPLFSPAASWGLKICDIILTTSIEWIYWTANLPYAAVKTLTPSVIEIICAYALLASVLYLLFPKSDRNSDNNKLQNKTDNKQQPNENSTLNGPDRAIKSLKHLYIDKFIVMRQKTPSDRKWALIFLGVTLFVLSADIFYWVQKRWWKDDVTVSIVDVGQGNAALIEMPKGQCALIDGGGYSNNSIFNIGEKVIAPFLWRKKIKTVETVILTHYDADHLNGLIYILKHFNVKQVFANHDTATCSKNKDFVDLIHNKQIHYPPYNTFSKNLEINGVMLKILYPVKNFADLALKDSWRNSNNNSMVVQVNFGNHNILFPGDIMKEAEEELVDLNYDLQSTIMVAPHHGSSSSSTPEFLKNVNPKYIIISAGRQNRFGFPAPDVLARYEKNKIITFRTDVNGGVSISNDGKHLTLAPLNGEKIMLYN
ncbi:MAG: DUF4131 domain-containing protein [Desulfobacteraceae bacterium]|nr:ComEC/Rec2 family competence protein [Desulfobacteraceae bacterium]MBC2756196.1 DUF4131 domain-containing protein [Desulfobacteraceae bacterium]